MVLSINMGLQLPVVGVDSGFVWENAIDANSNILDLHNHSAGSGVQITPLGLNINSDLTFNSHSATNLFGVGFSLPASTALTSFLYTNAQSGGGVYDLFFNDGAGNVIPITKAGVVNSIASSIPGESYSGGTFTWVQGSGSSTPANFDIGQITLRPNTSGTTNGIALQVPSGISSAYNVILPSLPASTLFLTISSTGQMGTASSIQGTQIATGSLTGAQLANNTVGSSQLAASLSISANFTAGGTIFAGGSMYPAGGSIAGIIGRSENTIDIRDPLSGSSHPIVVSANPGTSGLMIVRGVVSSSGTVAQGEGFSVTRVSTGVYAVTWSVAFVDAPAMVVTAQTNQNYFGIVSVLNTTTATIAMNNTSGTPVDVAVSFIAIGQRLT